MQNHKEFRWVVSSDEEGMTLLAFLRERCPEAPSAKALKRAIEQKYCEINGTVKTFPSHPLRKGDRVALNTEAFEAKEEIAPLKILYEDTFLLICNKPVGLVCENRLFNQALPSYQNKLHLVHRLDKETSGVIILAKNEKASEKMERLFSDREVHKSYLALVDGAVLKEEGLIDEEIGPQNAFQGQTVYQVVKKGKGKKAVTSWKCVKRGETASLLLCEPQTGRTHQLRVHLSAMGHPILGDHQYGKRFRCSLKPKRHLLHAYSISFMHPDLHKEIKVTCPIPSDFKAAMNSVLEKSTE